jgi:protein-serine/threonine kinase
MQPTPPRPGGLTKRFQRMFSQSNGRVIPGEKSPEPRDGSMSDASYTAQPSEPSSRTPSRTPSHRGEHGRKPSIMGRSKENKEVEPQKRFEPLPDGGHEHHLKSAKRQEKLTGMLRDMLGGKKREEPEDQQQLSLMSTWVDQLKNERDKLATDKKGGPNSTATLVEKYGKCQEIVGRGAFGIVRISHKQDPNDSRNEQLYAVKEFRRRPQESAKKYQKRLTAEFCISSSLRHPNVIHTLDLLQDAKGE